MRTVVLAEKFRQPGVTVLERLVLTVVCTLVVVLVSPAVCGAEAGGGGVGAAPVPGASGVRAKGGYFAPTIAPGSTWSSELLVSNSGSKVASIRVYAADGVTASASGAVYSDLGQALSATGTWLTPASQTVVVKAGGQTTVRFKVTVPKSAAPGDYLAGIVAQNEAPVHSGTGDMRVNIVTRSVVGVLVSVPGLASFNVKVGKPTIEKGPEQIGEVVTPITDTGHLIGKPIDTVSLIGPDGYERTVPRHVDTLLPSGTAYFPIYWPDHLHGLYTVRSCVSGGGLAHTVCNSATVNLERSTRTVGVRNGKPLAVAGRTPTWVIALVSGGVGCALALAVVGLGRWRRRGADRRHSAALVARRG